MLSLSTGLALLAAGHDKTVMGWLHCLAKAGWGTAFAGSVPGSNIHLQAGSNRTASAVDALLDSKRAGSAPSHGFTGRYTVVEVLHGSETLAFADSCPQWHCTALQADSTDAVCTAWAVQG